MNQKNLDVVYRVTIKTWVLEMCLIYSFGIFAPKGVLYLMESSPVFKRTFAQCNITKRNAQIISYDCENYCEKAFVFIDANKCNSMELTTRSTSLTFAVRGPKGPKWTKVNQIVL